MSIPTEPIGSLPRPRELLEAWSEYGVGQLQAARHLPADRLGTCDDSGFAPFADDTSTSQETAYAKIEARLRGTELAAEALGL